MTLDEAVKAGHRRVRLPYWANAEDYILLDIFVHFDGSPLRGPWGKLYSPIQLLGMEGIDRPQTVFMGTDRGAEWEPYVGPRAEDEAPGRDERERQPFD